MFARVNTRRQFLIQAPLSLLGAAAACSGDTQKPGTPPVTSNPSTTAGAPPAFGTAPLTGPEVSPQTFAEAGKLAQVTLTPAEQKLAADSWRRTMASYIERRTGPRKVELEDTLAPATIWNPGFVGTPAAPTRDRFVRSNTDAGPLPQSDDEDRVRSGDAPRALDRNAQAQL